MLNVLLPELCEQVLRSAWWVHPSLPWSYACLSRSPVSSSLTHWSSWWPPHSYAPVLSSTALFLSNPVSFEQGERSFKGTENGSEWLDPVVSSVSASSPDITRTKTLSAFAKSHLQVVAIGFWVVKCELDCLVPCFPAAVLCSSRQRKKTKIGIADFSLKLPAQVIHQKKHLARSNSKTS